MSLFLGRFLRVSRSPAQCCMRVLTYYYLFFLLFHSHFSSLSVARYLLCYWYCCCTKMNLFCIYLLILSMCIFSVPFTKQYVDFSFFSCSWSRSNGDESAHASISFLPRRRRRRRSHHCCCYWTRFWYATKMSLTHCGITFSIFMNFCRKKNPTTLWQLAKQADFPCSILLRACAHACISCKVWTAARIRSSKCESEYDGKIAYKTVYKSDLKLAPTRSVPLHQ